MKRGSTLLRDKLRTLQDDKLFHEASMKRLEEEIKHIRATLPILQALEQGEPSPSPPNIGVLLLAAETTTPPTPLSTATGTTKDHHHQHTLSVPTTTSAAQQQQQHNKQTTHRSPTTTHLNSLPSPVSPNTIYRPVMPTHHIPPPPTRLFKATGASPMTPVTPSSSSGGASVQSSSSSSSSDTTTTVDGSSEEELSRMQMKFTMANQQPSTPPIKVSSPATATATTTTTSTPTPTTSATITAAPSSSSSNAAIAMTTSEQQPQQPPTSPTITTTPTTTSMTTTTTPSPITTPSQTYGKKRSFATAIAGSSPVSSSPPTSFGAKKSRRTPVMIEWQGAKYLTKQDLELSTGVSDPTHKSKIKKYKDVRNTQENPFTCVGEEHYAELHRQQPDLKLNQFTSLYADSSSRIIRLFTVDYMDFLIKFYTNN